VRRDEQTEKIEGVRKLAASPQIKRDNHPPRILDQIIEMMFPLATLGGFNFDARLLPVQSIDDTKYESSDDSEPDVASCEGCGRAATDDKTSNRNLVWRDSRFAKKRDNCRFDWSVNVSGQVECSILRGIENDALRYTTILLPWRGKTEWPHAATHAENVVIFRCRVDDIDVAIVDSLFELLKERHGRRKRRKKIFRDQRRPTWILD